MDLEERINVRVRSYIENPSNSIATRQEINEGHCHDFARRLARDHEGVQALQAPGHSVLVYDRRFFDAECPEGVRRLDELPFYQCNPEHHPDPEQIHVRVSSETVRSNMNESSIPSHEGRKTMDLVQELIEEVKSSEYLDFVRHNGKHASARNCDEIVAWTEQPVTPGGNIKKAVIVLADDEEEIRLHAQSLGVNSEAHDRESLEGISDSNVVHDYVQKIEGRIEELNEAFTGSSLDIDPSL